MGLEYMLLNFYYTYFIKISRIEWLAICITFLSVFLIELFKTYSEKRIWFEAFSCKTGIIKGLLLSYYEFAIIVTVINRTNGDKRLCNFNLFWTIKEVLLNHDLLLLQEIIINILMFIPIGVLLCSLLNMRKQQSLLKNILIISMCLSVLIEVTQYIFYKGTMELDDVVYNCIGAVVGLLFYRLTRKIWLIVRRK